MKPDDECLLKLELARYWFQYVEWGVLDARHRATPIGAREKSEVPFSTLAIIFEAGNDKSDSENPTSGPAHEIRTEGDTIQETHGNDSAAVQRDFAGVTP